MKERPILMKAEMVRAILRDENPKSQTRRVIKPQPDPAINWDKCPYGKPGDRLWVKETFIKWSIGGGSGILYRATDPDADDGPWMSSRFMRREYSRITLDVTDIRVQRIRDIKTKDIFAEGVRIPVSPDSNYLMRVTGNYKPASYLECGLDIATNEDLIRAEWAALWDSINATPKPVKIEGEISHYISYPWDDVQEVREHRGLPWHLHGNPWVWVVGFKRVDDEE